MSKWNIEEVSSKAGKVAVVTGANSGLGFEAALELAKKDYEVVLACRNMQKAEDTKSRILREHPQAHLKAMTVDLSSLKQVRNFAAELQKHYETLDLLINNAGIMMSPYHVTEDGFENQLATNYLGHFALTGLLLPLITAKSGSRIVTLSSLSYKWSEIQFEDMHFEKGYDKKKAYGQSKRACLVFAYELQRRLSASVYDTLSVAAHPGLSNTNLDRYFPALIKPLGAIILQNVKKGVLPVLYAALDSNIKGGEYIGPDGFQEMRGYPSRVDSDASSKDQKIAERLWDASEKMTGVAYLNPKRSEQSSSI